MNAQTEGQRMDCHQLLSPCSNKPNCVSSLVAQDDAHFISPLILGDQPTHDWQSLMAILLSMPRTRIVTQQDCYLHVECQSRLFGFVDDLELCLLVDDKICHLRSAARTGYYDFNVNRKRIEKIRHTLNLMA